MPSPKATSFASRMAAMAISVGSDGVSSDRRWVGSADGGGGGGSGGGDGSGSGVGGAADDSGGGSNVGGGGGGHADGSGDSGSSGNGRTRGGGNAVCNDTGGGTAHVGRGVAAAAVAATPAATPAANSVATPEVPLGAPFRLPPPPGGLPDSPSAWEDVQRREMLARLKREFFMPSLVDNPYTVNHVVGEGAYGVVVSATDTRTGEEVAIKRIVCVFDEPGESTRILRELKFLRLLAAHPNIITLRDVLLPADPTTFNDVFLVFELLPSDLSRVLRCAHLVRLSIAHKRSIMFQLLRGVAFLHGSAVYHRDIKASNVLLDDDCRVRICDFGLARALLPGTPAPTAGGPAWTDYVATRWYRAPELLLSPAAVAYSTAIDVWSVGCIFAELLCNGAPLFPGVDRQDMISRMAALLGVPSATYISGVADAAARRFLASIPPPPPVGHRRRRRGGGGQRRRPRAAVVPTAATAGATRPTPTAASDAAAAASVTAPPRTAPPNRLRPQPLCDVDARGGRGGVLSPYAAGQADSSDADNEARVRGHLPSCSSSSGDDGDEFDGDEGGYDDGAQGGRTVSPAQEGEPRPPWDPAPETLDRLARVFPLGTPPAAVRIVASLLTFDAAIRPGAADILADPWFKPLAAAAEAAEADAPVPERVVLPPAEFAFEGRVGSGGAGLSKAALRALFMDEMRQRAGQQPGGVDGVDVGPAGGGGSAGGGGGRRGAPPAGASPKGVAPVLPPLPPTPAPMRGGGRCAWTWGRRRRRRGGVGGVHCRWGQHHRGRRRRCCLDVSATGEGGLEGSCIRSIPADGPVYHTRLTEGRTRSAGIPAGEERLDSGGTADMPAQWTYARHPRRRWCRRRTDAVTAMAGG
ncbi:hypothetical protein MMPV_008891 [Pyropia vietnamensis]